MFRWYWWNRSPYMLLNCWAILIFVNLYFIVKITHLMDAEGGRTGAKRVRNAPAGAGKEVLVTGSCPEGASGCRLCGLGAKMGSFGILVHGFDAGGATRGGTARSASRNSTGRGSSPK